MWKHESVFLVAPAEPFTYMMLRSDAAKIWLHVDIEEESSFGS